MPFTTRTRTRIQMAIVAALLAEILVVVAMKASLWSASANDFNSFYESGRALLERRDLYLNMPAGAVNNLNLPATTLLFAPFALFARSPAFILWTALGLVAVVAVVHIVSALKPDVSPLALAGVLLISGASPIAWKLGQMTWVMLALVTIAWKADRQRRSTALGLALGAAVYMKPFLALLLVYFAWRREWRALSTAFATGLALTAIGLLVGGVRSYQSWLFVLEMQNQGQGHTLNASIAGLIRRNMSRSPAILHVTPIAELGLTSWLIIAADVGVLVALVRARLDDRDRAWAALVVASLLLSPLGWTYYVPLAFGPVVTLWPRLSRAGRSAIGAAAVLFCTPAPSDVLGPIGTLTWGSVYGWAALLLFIGVLTDGGPPGRRLPKANSTQVADRPHA